MAKGLFDEWEEEPQMTKQEAPAAKQSAPVAPPSEDVELVQAGEYLAQMLDRLQAGVEALLDRVDATPAAPQGLQQLSGIEEEKLLASIEKWQRRFNALDEEYKVLAAAYTELQERSELLEQENELLRHAANEEQEDGVRQRALYDELSARLDKSIAMLDKVLN